MIRGVLVVLVAATAACRAAPPYRAPTNMGARATFDAIIADGEAGIAPEDEALWRCELATAALEVGDERVAFRSLQAAGGIMGTLESTSAEDARAIFGEEATKNWKGDPYERCMSCLYKGLLYWRQGQLGNASACFKRGLLADAYSEAGEHQRDFAVLSYLLGWVSYLRGKHEQARYSFDEAAKHNERNPYFRDPRPDEYNILVVADIGRGPVKFADGAGGHIARFARQPHQDFGIEVYVDGKRAGRSYQGTDLYVQATTRGKRSLDGIRAGKAVFKGATHVAGAVALTEGTFRGKGELAAIGIGLLLLSGLTRAEADTRHWRLLPAQVHVLPLKIEPGRHRLRVHVYGRSGRRIKGWFRNFEVDVDPRDTLYFFRTGRGRTIHGLTDKWSNSDTEP